MAVAFMGHGFRKVALVTAAALTLGLGALSTSGAAVPQEQKEQIVLLYALRMAPEYCKWTDVGDLSKLDAKIAEAEKALEITADEKAKFVAMASGEVAKPETCTDGFVRSMLEEAVK